jgi:hypothetical protein
MFAGLRAATGISLRRSEPPSLSSGKHVLIQVSGQSHVETKKMTVYLALDVARYVNRLVYVRHG